ncbi:neuronal PAS domain-containing protein 4A [Calliphora vicina]|uniref:neuronal PAS domain-containing protein 4A n=1 Tax=Calliphora vicina TaxID=7373 RepID=UPI00325B95C5
MAFTRHQIEKRRLIELVKLNPILWDCRLPHYKRSDKKKALKWNELGRIFSVNGERVQRTFTSLREIFRRELNHEKMLGARFKSKWEYYDEMAFLKEVIRERKSRERAKSNDVMPPNLNNTNNNTSTGIDEYQYFAPNDPNNPQNQSTTPPITATQASLLPLTQPITVSQILPTTTHNGNSTPLLPPLNPSNLSLPMTTIATTQLQPDVLLNLTPTTLAALQKLNASNSTFPNQQPSRPLSRARSLTIRSCSSSPSIYIKDEPDSLEDTISLDTNSNGKIKDTHKSLNSRSKDTSSKLLLNSKNLNSSTQNLVIDERDCSDLDDDPDDDVDMLDDRLSIATSLQSLNKEPPVAAVGNNSHHPTPRSQPLHNLYPKPTAREILYTKFGEFLAARLNTLNETVANELMNKILMLIAEK